MHVRSAAGVVVLLLSLGLAGCATSGPQPSDMADTQETATMAPVEPADGGAVPEGAEAMAEVDTPTAATQGAWIGHAAYESDPSAYHALGDVVLFFNATWCPTCRATVKSLAADGAPSGLTVVDVDFDSSADLRQRYGVTVQHTFVQVDATGAELATFTGPTTGDGIAAKTV